MHGFVARHFKTPWSTCKEIPFNQTFTCRRETDNPAIIRDYMDQTFITGATGLIGRRVVQQLAAHNITPTCLLRAGRKLDGLPARAKVRGDILDPASLREGMRGATQVIHLAAVADWERIDTPPVWQTIVEGTRNVLAAAKHCGVRRVLHVSSAAAIDGTLQPRLLDENAPFTLPRRGYLYAHAKRKAEAICQEFQREGLPTLIVNPAETYDPEAPGHCTTANLHRLARGRSAYVTRGGTGVVHAEDVATGILAALQQGHPGQRYILSAENLGNSRIAHIVRETCGKPADIREVPNWLALFLAGIERRLRLPLGLNPGLIPYATRYWFMDSRKARQDLGWRPRSGTETLTTTLTQHPAPNPCRPHGASREMPHPPSPSGS